MTFLAPIVLTGLAAISVPVAIHLLNKMRVKVVKWAAMRFLQDAVQKNNRRLQVEDLILLILRCLLVALLVLAFAQPVLNPGGSSSGAMSGSGPRMTIFLVDVSASMGQSNGVETRLDAARQAVDKELDALPADTQVALYLVSDRVNQVVPRLTPSTAVVKSTLAQATPTDRSGEMLPGIRAALDTLRPVSGAKKEILVFTDGQATAWRELEAIREELARNPEVELRAIPVAEQGEDNLAITALRPESLVPAVGQLFSCLVEVTNWGGSPMTGIRVTLSLEDGAPSDEAIIDRIDPGQSQTARLNVRFNEAGYHTLTAAIPPDRLPADNSRSLAVQVVDSVRAAVIEGGSAVQWQDRDAFFVVNALAPVADARRADYFLKPHVETPTWAETADLSREELVFLVNVGKPSPALGAALKQYVLGGGSLVIFPGSRVTSVDDYNNNADLREILPATLGLMKNAAQAGSLASWQASAYRHPVTLLWNEEGAGNLGSVRASQYFELQPVTGLQGDQAPRVVVTYQDGSPAVVERTAGAGKVVLFSSSGTTEWQNLPIHPNFVPFMQRLAGHLSNTRSPNALNLSPGAVFQQTVKEDLTGREFQVTRPGEGTKRRSAGTVQRRDRSGMVRYRDTEKSGAYQLFFDGEARPFAALAVQMDPAEANLRTIPATELARLSRAPEEGEASATAAGESRGRRYEFWTLLVALAALAALAESALAHRFSLAK